MSRPIDLPELVSAFLVKYIDSISELEGLLLLRAEPETSWTSARLASRLYIDEPTAAAVLELLRRHNLVVREEQGWRYAPAEALRPAIEALANSYREFLIPITNLVHAKPRASLREFSEAFRLKEDL